MNCGLCVVCIPHSENYLYLGIFWNFSEFSWYQSFHQWQRLIYYSAHYKLTDLHFTVICYVHPLIHLTSKTPSLRILNFLDFSSYVVIILIFLTNLRKCASISKKRGYPDSVVNTGQQLAQQINRHSALQTPQKEYKRIPFTLIIHPHIRAVKSNVFKTTNFSKSTEVELFITGTEKSTGNFRVRSALKSDDQPSTFECGRTRYNTCPFTFTTQEKYLDPRELLKSLIILHAL